MPIKVCRHIKPNGVRCGSPALRGHIFCCHHVEAERRLRRCVALRHASSCIQLPPLTDPPAIRAALTSVMTALAESRIPTQRAALLLHGLHIATNNARAVSSA